MKKIAYAAVLISLLSLVSGCNRQPSSDEYIKSGLEYVAKKEWKSAIIEFKNAVKQAPKNAKARALLGKTYLETQSANAAIKEFTRAIEFGYDKSELSISLAMAYRQAGESQSIIDDIVVADNQSGTDRAIINAIRGGAYLQLGDKGAARDALEIARKQDGEATEVRLAWATYEKINGNIEAQERLLQPLLERDGGVADGWSQMGKIEKRRSNLDAAEKALNDALLMTKDPDKKQSINDWLKNL